MKNTTMTWLRKGVVQRAGIAMYLENMSFRQAAELGGQSPYDSFWAITTGGITLSVRRGDLFIDVLETDPLTNVNTQYRVFGNPEGGDLISDSEIPLEKVTGS